MNRINHVDVQEMIEGKKSFLLINVLPEESFDEGHIPRSINIPLQGDDFTGRVEKEAGSKAKPIVVYCGSSDCDLSPQAAKKLEAAGFDNIADFEGGMKEWQEAGLQVHAGV